MVRYVQRKDTGLQMPPALPRAELPVDGELVIDLMGDLHVGSPACDEARIAADVAETAADPRRYLVLNGDLLNNDLKASKHGGVYEAARSPDAALDWLEELLGDTVRGRILAIVGGNHDHRTTHQTGIDPIRQLAARLKLADKYLPHGGFVTTCHGTHKASRHRSGAPRGIEYTGFVSHGTGNGPSSVSAERVCRVFHADWYGLGHTHTPLATGELYYMRCPQTGTVVPHTKRVAVSGAYLGYEGYALERRYVPRPPGRASLALADGRKAVRVWLP